MPIDVVYIYIFHPSIRFSSLSAIRPLAVSAEISSLDLKPKNLISLRLASSSFTVPALAHLTSLLLQFLARLRLVPYSYCESPLKILSTPLVCHKENKV